MNTRQIERTSDVAALRRLQRAERIARERRREAERADVAPMARQECLVAAEEEQPDGSSGQALTAELELIERDIDAAHRNDARGCACRVRHCGTVRAAELSRSASGPDDHERRQSERGGRAGEVGRHGENWCTTRLTAANGATVHLDMRSCRVEWDRTEACALSLASAR